MSFVFYRKGKRLGHQYYLLSPLSVKLANSLKPGYFCSPEAIKLHHDLLEVVSVFLTFLSQHLTEGLGSNSKCWLNDKVSESAMPALYFSTCFRPWTMHTLNKLNLPRGVVLKVGSSGTLLPKASLCTEQWTLGWLSWTWCFQLDAVVSPARETWADEDDSSQLWSFMAESAILFLMCFLLHVAALTSSVRLIKEVVCGPHLGRCGPLFLHSENISANPFWFIFSFFNQAETLQLKYR